MPTTIPPELGKMYIGSLPFPEFQMERRDYLPNSIAGMPLPAPAPTQDYTGFKLRILGHVPTGDGSGGIEYRILESNVNAEAGEGSGSVSLKIATSGNIPQGTEFPKTYVHATALPFKPSFCPVDVVHSATATVFPEFNSFGGEGSIPMTAAQKRELTVRYPGYNSVAHRCLSVINHYWFEPELAIGPGNYYSTQQLDNFTTLDVIDLYSEGVKNRMGSFPRLAYFRYNFPNSNPNSWQTTSDPGSLTFIRRVFYIGAPYIPICERGKEGEDPLPPKKITPDSLAFARSTANRPTIFYVVGGELMARTYETADGRDAESPHREVSVSREEASGSGAGENEFPQSGSGSAEEFACNSPSAWDAECAAPSARASGTLQCAWLDAGKVKVATSYDGARSFNVIQVTGAAYDRATTCRHAGRIIIAGYKKDQPAPEETPAEETTPAAGETPAEETPTEETPEPPDKGKWFVRVGKPTGAATTGAGAYEWSEEEQQIPIEGEASGSAEIRVRDDGAIEFCYLTPEGLPTILQASALGNDGTGDWF